MIDRFDILLPLGAIGFYLYDAAMLLYSNELVLVHAGDRWRVSGGWELRVAGRRLYLPNPLTPQRPIYRVHWRVPETRTAVEAPDALAAFEHSLRPLRFLTIALLALLLPVLPAVSLVLGAGWTLLIVFALFYGFVVVALAMTYRRRELWGLNGKAYLLLAVDSLACAPFAVNLLRKVTLRRSIAGDPFKFAMEWLDGAAKAALSRVVTARIADDLARTEPGTQQHDLLEQARSHVAKIFA